MFGKLRILTKHLASVAVPATVAEVALDNVSEKPRIVVAGLDRSQLTMWERWKSIFQTNDMGEQTPDMNFIVQSALFGAIGGFILGGVSKSRTTLHNFVETNDATKFANMKDAKRVLSDKLLLAFGRGGGGWAIRMGCFAGGFALISCSIAALRNKEEGILEYFLAGITVGALDRFNYGIRGMVAGGTFGSLLGLSYGCIVVPLQRLAGCSLQEMRTTFYEFSSFRRRAYEKGRHEAELAKMNPVEAEFARRTSQLPNTLEHLLDEKKAKENVEEKIPEKLKNNS